MHIWHSVIKVQVPSEKNYAFTSYGNKVCTGSLCASQLPPKGQQPTGPYHGKYGRRSIEKSLRSQYVWFERHTQNERVSLRYGTVSS